MYIHIFIDPHIQWHLFGLFAVAEVILEEDTFSVDESVGYIQVCVVLQGGGPLEQPVELTISTTDGTATGLCQTIRNFPLLSSSSLLKQHC